MASKDKREERKGFEVGRCTECNEPVYGSRKLQLYKGQRLVCLSCISLAQEEGKEVIKSNERVLV